MSGQVFNFQPLFGGPHALYTMVFDLSSLLLLGVLLTAMLVPILPRFTMQVAEGKIEEAETYMEERRQIFLRNGYLVRKLNQAFFAFNGAYADVPGGAAGQDPVGPAVRALRAQSGSLAEFVNTMSWMWSFEQLQETLAR